MESRGKRLVALATVNNKLTRTSQNDDSENDNNVSLYDSGQSNSVEKNSTDLENLAVVDSENDKNVSHYDSGQTNSVEENVIEFNYSIGQENVFDNTRKEDSIGNQVNDRLNISDNLIFNHFEEEKVLQSLHNINNLNNDVNIKPVGENNILDCSKRQDNVETQEIDAINITNLSISENTFNNDNIFAEAVNSSIFLLDENNLDFTVIENSIVLKEDTNVVVEVLNKGQIILEDALNKSQNEPDVLQVIEHEYKKDPVLSIEYKNNENNILERNYVQKKNQEEGAVSENKKKRPRKRKANKELWERNVRKKQRLMGESYTTAQGKVIPGKLSSPIENCGCRFKCDLKITRDRQEELFKEYYGFNDNVRQKSFISSLVQENPVLRKRKRNPEKTGKEKQKSRVYSLPDADKEKHRVCLKFFCAVFQISFQVVDLALKKTSSSGVFLGTDGRIGRPASNATLAEVILQVKKHIDSFPRTEAHYVRKNSKKLYLAPELNIAELYRLYINDFCLRESIKEPVKEGVFRKIFNSYDPPLSTFVPKKDQCSRCNQYKNAVDKSDLEEDYQTHRRRKTEAMDMKSEEMNIKENDMVTATFDLQAVLSVPFAGDAQIYYKRKLSVYNFTIYDSRGEGFCYVWDESNGMKGSSEIGTGLITYMTNLPKNIQHVTTYSDTCGGQNRNQYIASGMMYVVNKTQIETVNLKFMESGHTYLEADSMHATIEKARKHKRIYTPQEWAVLIAMARKKPKPYNVTTFNYNQMFNLINLGKSLIFNRSKNTDGETVKWLKIKWLKFEKANPFVILYKYELKNDEDFMSIDVRMNCHEQFTWESTVLTPKYKERIPISSAKKRISYIF